MSKVSRIIVDDTGNVSSDFSGYEGDSCLIEEEKLRRLLAEFGLQMTPVALIPKSAAASQSVSHRKRFKV